jgi:cytochrome c553
MIKSSLRVLKKELENMGKRFFAAAVCGLFTTTLVSLSVPAKAGETSSIARGGRLYDKWFAVIGAEKPKSTHKAWPASNTKKKGNVTWRCKSCHGWDLKGKDGAYASGSYKTGIKGLKRLAGDDPAKVVTVIKDETHGMGGLMSPRDMRDLALFVTKGQVDLSKIIATDKKVIGGDAAKGAAYYRRVCAFCHGVNGRRPRGLPKPLGALIAKNPWEVFHKIQNGQPRQQMPAMRGRPLQVTIDLMAHMMTMPKK